MRARTISGALTGLVAISAGLFFVLSANQGVLPPAPTGGAETVEAIHRDIPAARVPEAVPGQQTYSFVAQATGTVEALMQEKRKDGSLRFTSRNYPTLGSFLESLGGLKNAGGSYWMLTINGSYSSVGMSEALVVPGDFIEWRYE